MSDIEWPDMAKSSKKAPKKMPEPEPRKEVPKSLQVTVTGRAGFTPETAQSFSVKQFKCEHIEMDAVSGVLIMTITPPPDDGNGHERPKPIKVDIGSATNIVATVNPNNYTVTIW